MKSDLGSSYQKTFDGIKSGEQVVLYIRNAYYSYSYKEEVNNKTVTRYGSFDWAEIIRQLNEKGVIVIAVVENDKEFYDSINTTNKIFLDGNYDTTYAQAIDIIVKGKETK